MSGFLPGKTLRGVGDHVTISSVKSSLLEGWGLDCENGDSGDGCTCGQWPSDQFLAFYWVVGWFCVEWQADKRWEIEENEGLSSHPSACKLHAHPPVWEVLVTLKSKCSTPPEVIAPATRYCHTCDPPQPFWYQKIRAGKEARREFHG